MYKHILITTDGSDNAAHGVDHGLALAAGTGAAVTILTSTPPFPVAYAAFGAGSYTPATVLQEYDAAQEKAGHEILSAVAAKAAQLGVKCNTKLVPNTLPAEAIVQNADTLGCDLICMASHGRRGLSRILLGSQAAEVVARAKMPVLIVRGTGQS